MSGGGAEMSSQELSHNSYTHGVTGLYSPSHYFLHAQYHPQYPKPYDPPHNPQGNHNPQTNPQQSVQPQTQANGYGLKEEGRDDPNQNRSPNEREVYREYSLPLLDKTEKNHPINGTNHSQEPKQISPISISSDVKLEEQQQPASAKEQLLDSAGKEKDSPHWVSQEPSSDAKTESPPPSQKPSTGLTPDESEARRHIDSFISDQKNHQRADTFSPEDNRSRHDSFYNSQSRYQVSRL